MNTWLMVLSWLLPLLILSAAGTRLWRLAGHWLAVAAVLPALAASQLVPAGFRLELDWLLLGVVLQLDETAQRFLSMSALFWLFAALYAAFCRSEARFPGRLRVFFLMAMAGNLLLILAADMLTFYVGFAAMGLSAYGMIVQRLSQRARHAGRIYLVWTLLGEVALFSGIAFLAAASGSVQFSALTAQALPTPAIVLILFGFGIKLALPGLHFWLPITYASAPAVVAAVMSGPMITAGLLGWLRFLPAEAPGLAAWSHALMVVGLIGVVLGIIAGVLQHHPRTVLGYSSVLKMGVVTSVFGATLAHPGAASALMAALTLYALHHLLVKGALFMGIGEWERSGSTRWLLIGFGALALALSGAPLTGGAAAKSLLKASAAPLTTDLTLILMLSAAGTLMLMGRMFWLLLARKAPSAEQRIPATAWVWLALVISAVWLPVNPFSAGFSLADLVPLVISLIVVWIVWSSSERRRAVKRISQHVHPCRVLPCRMLQQFMVRIQAVRGLPFVMPLQAFKVSITGLSQQATTGLLWLLVLLGILALLVIE